MITWYYVKVSLLGSLGLGTGLGSVESGVEKVVVRPDIFEGGDGGGIGLPPMEVTDILEEERGEADGLIYSPSISGVLAPLPEMDDEDRVLFSLEP